MEITKEELKTIIQTAISDANKLDKKNLLSWTIEECAIHSGIGETKIRELVAAEKTDFPFIKIGKKAVIPVDLFKSWLYEKARNQTGI